jgi:hypothetical protein
VDAAVGGFYAPALGVQECDVYRGAVVGSLDEEIRWAKVRLFRLVQKSGRGRAKVDALLDKQMELIRKLELARVALLKAGIGEVEEALGDIEIEVVGGESSS